MEEIKAHLKVADKIRALLAKTQEAGCTEAEAMAAAAKAQELLALYGLSLSDVEVREEPIGKMTCETGWEKRRHPALACLSAIAIYTHTKTWRKGPNPIFFGQYSDTILAKHIFLVAQSAIDTTTSVARKLRAIGPGESRDFGLGMANSMSATLRQMAAEAEPTLRTSQGTALVPLKMALVEEALAKLGMRFCKGAGMGVSSNGAYGRGQEAGKTVAFHKPLDLNLRKMIG